MKKSKVILIIISLVCILIGAAMVTGAYFSLVNDASGQLAALEFQEKTHAITEPFTKLNIRTVNSSIEILPSSDEYCPGAGAAGGLGFALLSYLGATLESGVDMVIRETNLLEKIKDADFVITGEGRLDGQSYQGKAPIGVAKAAKQFGKPVIGFAGCVTEDAKICNQHGIDALFPIVRTPCSLAEAMDVENAYRNLADTAEQVFRLIMIEK